VRQSDFVSIESDLIRLIPRIRLVAMRDKGNCPCPRCLVLKRDIYKMGQIRDLRSRITQARTYPRDNIQLARQFIYKQGYGVSSAAVERVLKANSWVPTLVKLFLQTLS
jgi:hypothetical protein